MRLVLIILVIIPFSIMGQTKVGPDAASTYGKLVKMISADALAARLHFLSSDFFQGRGAGTTGERAAAHYLAAHYKSLGIPPLSPGQDHSLESYLQKFEFNNGRDAGHSQNVLSFFEGTDPKLKREVIVLIAHYDHLGVGQRIGVDSIYNGAVDDASGTVALMEMAAAFQEARKQGLSTKRSLLFFHAGAEEPGTRGSSFYINNPIVPLGQIVAVINMDGVAGTDKPNESISSNYVYLLKNDSTSLPLAEVAHQVNKSSNINLKIQTPENPRVFNSDNKPFEYELIPALYFSTGLTEHYHKLTDEAATIDYSHMSKIVRLVFATSWQIANMQWQDGLATRKMFSDSGKFFCAPCGCKLDDKLFDQPGLCPDCKMSLYRKWVKVEQR